MLPMWTISHSLQFSHLPTFLCQLLIDAKAAAEVLGYTKSIWDADETPEDIEDEDWSDLTTEQKDAAVILGYTQEIWDNSD